MIPSGIYSLSTASQIMIIFSDYSNLRRTAISIIK